MSLPKEEKSAAFRVLLIGGTGTIGSDVLVRSIEKGHRTYVLNRGYTKKELPEGAFFLRGDIRTLEDRVHSVLGDLQFDVVVDFLSYSVSDLARTLRIFEKRCRQLIFISSVGAYDRRNAQGKLREDMPATGNPVWEYSVNKAACENFLKTYQFPDDVSYTVVRPAITYGNTRIPYGIMPVYGYHWTFAGRILAGKPVFLWDQGKALATVMHTEDFACALVDLFGNPKAKNEIFNLCGDEPLSWREILSIVGKVLNCEPLTVDIPSEYAADTLPAIRGILLGDRALDACYDNHKLKEACPDFSASVSISEGLERTVKYYREHHFLKGIDYQWDAMMDRLIAGYLRKKNPGTPLLSRLVFFDYLGNATWRDRFLYFVYRHMPSFVQKTVDVIRRACRKAGRFLIRK